MLYYLGLLLHELSDLDGGFRRAFVGDITGGGVVVEWHVATEKRSEPPGVRVSPESCGSNYSLMTDN